MSTKPVHSKGRHTDEVIAQYVEQLRKLRIGQSCFFVGARRAELEFLRRPALAAGMRIAIKEVQDDEIYRTSGVRVWRIPGSDDEL